MPFEGRRNLDVTRDQPATTSNGRIISVVAVLEDVAMPHVAAHISIEADDDAGDLALWSFDAIVIAGSARVPAGADDEVETSWRSLTTPM
jgi:hypothetical protein